MARVDTLPHFLTDVADAIREKKGTEETIQASDFDTEIENLPTGADLSEYFNNTITQNTSSSTNIQEQIVKKIENLTIPSSITSLASAINSFTLESITFSQSTDVSNVTSFNKMFSDCQILTSLDLSMFFTNSVTDMSSMFTNCFNIISIDLSNAVTNLVTNMRSMFSSCRSLQHLDIRNFTFDAVTSYTGIFSSVPANCEIIVKSQTEKDWVLTQRSDFTNVKTVAEYEAEQNA